MAVDVLHIGCAFYPYKGGSSIRLGTLISHQKNIRSHIVTHIREDDGQLHGAATITRLNKYFSLRTIWLLRRLVCQLQPESVVLHNPWVILLWIVFVDPFHKVRRVTEIHNFRDESWIKARICGCLYRQMDAVVVLSHKAVELVIRRYHVKRNCIFVIRNGVPRIPKLTTPTRADHRVVFSYVGTFHLWQGVFVLSEALRSLGDDFFRIAKVVLAGGGSQEHALHEASRPFIAQEQVQWCGWVEKRHADAILAGSDVILMPRLSTLGTEHVLPLKVFEAMNQGKAILATNVGGLTEVLEHNVNSWIIPPGDPDALAHAMFHLASHDHVRWELGERGGAQIKHFETWDDSGADYEMVLGLEAGKEGKNL